MNSSKIVLDVTYLVVLTDLDSKITALLLHTYLDSLKCDEPKFDMFNFMYFTLLPLVFQ